MSLGNPMKVGTAFLAGVIVALGSAVIYVRATDSPARPAVQAAPAAAPATTQPDANNPAAEPSSSPPSPAPAIKAAAVKQPQEERASAAPLYVPKPRVTRRPVSLAVVRHSPQPTEVTVPVDPPPLQVAQNQPAQMPQTGPVPPPSVPGRAVNDNESQPFTPPQSPYASPAPPPQPHTITLTPGTKLVIRLGEKLSTDHNYAGDAFRASLASPIIVDGFIIADKGSKVLGKVVNAVKSGKFEGQAELSVALTEINTTDGQRVRIETSSFDQKGGSNTNQNVAKMAGGAALGAIIGAIAGGGKGAAVGAGAGGAAGTGAVLLGHGKPAVIDNETQLSFQLTQPATITERLN